MFVKNVTRSSSGRFVQAMPWRPRQERCGAAPPDRSPHATRPTTIDPRTAADPISLLAVTTTPSALFDALDLQCRPWAGADRAIGRICDDSRAVSPGDLFIARPVDAASMQAHLAEALRRGAVALVATEAALGALRAADPEAVRVASAAVPHEALRRVAAAIAERFHGNPSRGLDLVGVTGTNGKTTVCFLLQQILAAGGRRCGLAGTVRVDDGRSIEPADLTTPGALRLSALLARMRTHGCDSAVMEVSSHGLDQERVAALRFRLGIFTNLTGDHLDYHGSFEAYRAAKRRLFEMLDRDARAIVNADDPAAIEMTSGIAAATITTAIDRPAAVRAEILEQTAAGTRCRVRTPWGGFETQMPLVGRHNLHNLLAAVAAAADLGVPIGVIERAAAALEAPPGRLEPVPAPGFSVFVDYAHTDDALRQVLQTLRPLRPPGASLRVLFGCGGDRDRTKRPRMGAVAAEFADELVVTSDNPRSEPPAAIVEEILAGVPASARSRVLVEVDRAAAIDRAIERSGPGDLLLIAGKGHEDYQIVGRDRRHFDDREVAAAAIAGRFGGGSSERIAVATG
jgi:UDP-N-acetylmuramoyl-L-alanyl-D-glutamate--2,6-diaminopimelate ligase